ncbi:MAG: hypothetical protein M3290_02725, partial [Actinomycetota bacterium]|nr:hypothetical protein [Actinomycetota bacterium]
TRFDGDDMNPSWSPLGDRIAFTSTRGESDDIYTIHPDGTGAHLVVAGPYADAFPSWSPAGDMLAYQAFRVGGYQVRTVRADGTFDRTFVKAGSFAGYPAWSPDGTEIVYSDTKYGTMNLWRKPLSGGRAHRVTFAGGAEISPSWATAAGASH